MKKSLVIVLVLALVVALTGCNLAGLASFVAPNVDPAVAMGSITEDRYINELFGIAFQLPENWVFATDEELAQSTDMAGEVFDESVIEDLLSSRQTLVNMSAWDEARIPNVNMNIQFIGGSRRMSMDDYTKSAAEQLPELMESVGVKVESLETRQVSFAGEERLGLFFRAEYTTGTFWQFSYYLMNDGYLGTVTCTANSVEEIEAVLPYFQALGQGE